MCAVTSLRRGNGSGIPRRPVASVCNSVIAAAGKVENATVVDVGRLLSVPAMSTVTLVFTPVVVYVAVYSVTPSSVCTRTGEVDVSAFAPAGAPDIRPD